MTGHADDGQSELPAAVVRLWRLSRPARTGRPATLSVDRVVATAAGLADRDGVADVPLTDVAAELGVAKMALYRHIGSKRELYDLMIDHVFATPPQLPRRGGWRTRLRAWVLRYRDVVGAHPWLTQIPVAGPPTGPNAIAWMDAMLGTLATTPLDWPHRLLVLDLLSGYVHGRVAQHAQLTRHHRDTAVDPADAARRYVQLLGRLVDPDTYPHAAALLASGVLDPAPAGPSDDDFERGLDLLLDGVAATIRATRRGPTRP